MTIPALGTPAVPLVLDPRAPIGDAPPASFADLLAAMRAPAQVPSVPAQPAPALAQPGAVTVQPAPAPAPAPPASVSAQPAAASSLPVAAIEPYPVAPRIMPTRDANPQPFVPSDGPTVPPAASPIAVSSPYDGAEGVAPPPAAPMQIIENARRPLGAAASPVARGCAMEPPATATVSDVSSVDAVQRVSIAALDHIDPAGAPALPTRAAVFNEDGLFRDLQGGGAAQDDPARPIDRPANAMPMPLPALAPTIASVVVDRTAAAQAAIAVADARVAPISAPRPAMAPPLADPLQVTHAFDPWPLPFTGAGLKASAASMPPASASAPGPVAALAPPPRADGTRSPARSGPVPAPRRAPQTDQPLQVDDAAQARLRLDAGPDGVRLLAAVSRTDREERSRLRDRIAGLLSRHGFALADVRLAGILSPRAKD